tara:strand:+ start:197 stop:436 length:240 start_codon:yes stop_codon:yes gene_type:complete
VVVEEITRTLLERTEEQLMEMVEVERMQHTPQELEMVQDTLADLVKATQMQVAVVVVPVKQAQQHLVEEQVVMELPIAF